MNQKLNNYFIFT